ncbi:zinc-dependent metalloprotease [Gelidibacter maritimus]|uniref:Zinc-dependent metalloprotease n=1 Tax=Gelidibacter maritimus TaxID=2761487 RepID=A0A7W2M5H9_9FLAO|nr:zinc-dependent metalloprotease [Gelidibacter maritimus]MBA6153095.1 zinc-dependent metalloprotease [Gelidibacter maritimus]
MKNIALICLLIGLNIKLSFGNIQTIIDPSSTSEQAAKQPFLTTLMKNGDLFLNIPHQLLDTPMLFVRYDQSMERKFMQVEWSLHKDKILLKVPPIHSSAGNILPLKPNLALSENILSIFPVEPQKNYKDIYTVNITNLVLNQVIEWTSDFTESIVPQISMLMDVKGLENEVIIKTQRGIILNQSKVSIPVFFGFCALPKPMESRRYDYRMGFFTELATVKNFDTNNRIANITRWRLQKKNKDQLISVPIKPITFLMSPEIPKKWRPYIKAGIEEWLPAFKAAGFNNAIVVKEVESLDNWALHSISNSVVHWGQKRYLRGFEDSRGSTISKIIDHRSGEILKADIHLGSSLKSLTDNYFIRVGPMDKRSQKFPFPDDLLGSLIQELTAHEAGHAVGIMDGNFGEYSYPFEKMNDVKWLDTMGYTPSVMNYTRYNNIVQPEDSISPSLLIKKVGPADIYNIEWAYTEFSKSISENEKEETLEGMVRLQDSIPWYRYNNTLFEIIGPAASNEVVETKDPVRSTNMALKNIKRVIALLPIVCSDQKDNARLERLYKKTLKLWWNHMKHVLTLIGGYDIHYKSINQPGKLYTPINWKIQEEALDFLLENVFDPPHWLTEPEFEVRTMYSTYPDYVVSYQQQLLIDMLDAARFKRLNYLETLSDHKGSVRDYLTKLQTGLFKELSGNVVAKNRRKQEIQKTYIDMLVMVLEKKRMTFDAESKYFDYPDYIKGHIMEQLLILKAEIVGWLNNNKDAPTVGHWEFCLKKLNTLL